MVAHTSNPTAWEAETEGSQVQGLPGQLSKTLYPSDFFFFFKKKKKKKEAGEVAQ